MLTDRQDPIIDYANNPAREIIIAKWVPRAKQTVQIKFDPAILGATAQIFAGNNTRVPLDSCVIDGQAWVQELDAGALYKVCIQGTERKTFFEAMAIDEVQDVTV